MKTNFFKFLFLVVVLLGGFSQKASAELKLMSFNVRYNTPKDTGVLN